VIDSGSAVSMVQISLNNRGGLFARPHSEVCLSPLRVFDWQFGLAARLDADHWIGGFTPSMNVKRSPTRQFAGRTSSITRLDPSPIRIVISYLRGEFGDEFRDEFRDDFGDASPLELSISRFETITPHSAHRALAPGVGSGAKTATEGSAAAGTQPTTAAIDAAASAIAARPATHRGRRNMASCVFILGPWSALSGMFSVRWRA